MKTKPTNSHPRRRVFAALCLAALLLAAAATLAWLNGGHPGPLLAQGLHIRIDGQDWEGADAVAQLTDGWGWLAGLGGLALGAVVAVVVLVLVAALLLLIVPLVLAFSVGLPLLIVAAVLAVVFSPLWLLVLLLIWALRPARRGATIRP
jgi:hypothetical protein